MFEKFTALLATIPATIKLAAALALASLLVLWVLWRLMSAYKVRKTAGLVAKGGLPQRGKYGPSGLLVAEGIAASLKIQSRLTAGSLQIWNGKAHLLRVADDDWSLGYVQGYALQVLRRSGVDAREASKAVEVSILGLYGDSAGRRLLGRLKNLEQIQDDSHHLGYEEGLRDGASWMASAGKIQPRGWADHIIDFERR